MAACPVLRGGGGRGGGLNMAACPVLGGGGKGGGGGGGGGLNMAACPVLGGGSIWLHVFMFAFSGKSRGLKVTQIFPEEG